MEYPNTPKDLVMIDDLDDLTTIDSTMDHTIYPILFLMLPITTLILLIRPTLPTNTKPMLASRTCRSYPSSIPAHTLVILFLCVMLPLSLIHI